MFESAKNVTPAPLPDQRQEDDPGFIGRMVSAISRFVKGRPERKSDQGRGRIACPFPDGKGAKCYPGAITGQAVRGRPGVYGYDNIINVPVCQ